jgi:HSP20 family protein
MAIRNMLPDVWRSERSTWKPMRELNRLQRRIDHIFDDFLNEPLPSLFKPTRELMPYEEEAEFTPACDIDETDTHYLLNFDLPGVKKSDVKIDLRGNQLTVSGERKEDKKSHMSRERYYGSFCRSFTLPADVNPDKVEANYEHGVLQIALTKTAISTSKQIPIKEGKLIEAKAEKAA